VTPEAILLAAFGIAIAAVLFWKLAWPKLAVPSGLHIGPIIGGKSRSIGLPRYLDRDGGFAFPHPTREQGHIHALVKPTRRVGNAIVLRYRIEADDGVTFHPQEHPGAGGEISLMLQRKGDDYSAKGEKAFYRLYGPTIQNLEPGEHTLIVEPRSAGWTGVMGGTPPSPAQWDDLLANLYCIHVCFGGRGGRAHGVFASGPARFTLVDLRLG
jgi:hypothetical protein